MGLTQLAVGDERVNVHLASEPSLNGKLFESEIDFFNKGLALIWCRVRDSKQGHA
jgi:hypothetical protein